MAKHRVLRQVPARGQFRRVLARAGIVVGILALSLTAYTAWQYHNLSSGIIRSDILEPSAGAGSPSGAAAFASTSPPTGPLVAGTVERSAAGPNPALASGGTNILLMGLDSRLDENGNPLPAAIYKALHTGGQNVGGENANVLILLHIAGNGGRSTAISIPRDDYTHLAGCPDGECMGKIKQAYGLALDQESRVLAREQNAPTGARREQVLRDAGRLAEIRTVERFLGGVTIDHFVEVTMVGFYELAQVVQPIMVCLAENTQDTYSGADFHAGRQQLDAAQALAFVRQRRDTVNAALNFTDLDRERRQQAFIISLAYQLKQAGTFINPLKVGGLIGVAKRNVAVDATLNLLSFAGEAEKLAGGKITYYTLPVDHFGTDPLGEDVNFVNLPLIQVTVRHLLATASTPAARTHARATAPPPPTVTASKLKPATAILATGAGVDAPPTALTALKGGGIPCVK